MIGSAGLPIGIQVASLPFHEEKIIQVMKVLEKGLKFNNNNLNH